MAKGERAGGDRRGLGSEAFAGADGRPSRWSAPRRRARRLAAYSVALTGAAVVLVGVRAATAPSAPPPAAQVRHVQALDSERTGVSSPVGLAFSAPAGRLFAVGRAASGDAASGTDVAVLAPSRPAERPAAARIAAAVQNPINMAFDDRRGRLLMLGHAGELLEVRADTGGTLEPQSLSRRDAVRLGLREPRGMAVDSGSGAVFVLDASGPRIVRVEPGADGSLDAATTTEIDLRAAGLTGVQGLAFDPATGHLHVRSGQSLVELTSAGSRVAARDLTGTGLLDPQALVFAPSGDQTDDPAQQSLWVADAGGAPGTGQIVELSLASVVTAASIDFTSALMRTVDLGAIVPPSTDPAGITYISGTDRFVVVDSEVEETVGGITHFQGANVWELSRLGAPLRTTNVSKVAPTATPMSNEAPGIAFNPANGHYYFVDDGVIRVFDLNPGADGLVGTSDDSWTSFTPIAENGDPEGIGVDTFTGRLFVADGVNREIYEYTTAGQYVGQFDVAQYGVNDPESVEFSPASGTLFVLSDRGSGSGNQTLVVETTTTGALIRTIDVGASNALKPAGLAYAPASDESGGMRFYVVDRGIDNNNDPNAVDGKLFELTAPAPGAPANTPPSADAGPGASATLPATVALDGTVTDDGNPNPPGAVTTVWTQVSGPGVITFGDAAAVDTTATASAAGVYVVRLTANDGQFTASDETTLTFTGSGATQSLDIRISAGPDDAEERTDATATVVLGNADLDLMDDTAGTPETNAVVGMRFPGVTIPPGATITHAYVQFQARRTNAVATLLTIRGQAADNPPAFTATNGNLSSRPTTAASAIWSPDTWLAIGDAGFAQRTTNIAAVVQEIVARPGWASGNALALFVTGSGSRVAESYNGVQAGAPLLHVEWTTGSGNSAPSITSDGGGDTASRSVAESQTAVTTVTASDPDNDPLTYSISGGADATRFTIVPSTGVLTFVSAPDYEAPVDANADNVYQVTVGVSDGGGGSDTQAISVTIVNVNEFAPVITSNDGGATATVSVAENQTTVTTVTASDGDGDPLAYAITGGEDAARFQIGDSTGVLTFVTAPDYESPADTNLDNVYEITVEASDGSLSDTQALSVAISDVVDGNQPPTAAAGPDQIITLPAGATLDGTVSDDGLPNPPGALTTTWAQTSGPGTVTFGNPSAVDTTATFSSAGAYVLRLTANDSELSAFDELTVTVNPAPLPDPIFSDGFESGTLSAWTSATTGGGDLNVDTVFKSSGTYGMRAVVNDNGAIFVTDDSPTAETRYRARFYFHPNAIPMGKNDAHFLFYGTNASGTAVVRVELRFNKKHQLRAGLLNDAGGYTNSGWSDLTNAWHPIEIDWRAATAAGANNGGLTLWVDGTQKASLSGVDNDTRRVDGARLGAVDGIDTATRGTYFFDAFVSRRQTYIGP